MAGLGNDFVADVAADAAIAGFMKMGAVKGTVAAVATPVIAGAMTVVAMATPLLIVGGIFYAVSKLCEDKPEQT